MKDIPVFTTQFGMATLILREIPFKKYAYVMVRSVVDGKLPALFAECRAFCHMAGATHVLATTDEPVDFLPHVHDMLEFTCRRCILPPPRTPVQLELITPQTGETFIKLYNQLFYPIINAATYTDVDLSRVLTQKNAYLAMVGGEVAGLGELGGDELCALGVLPQFHGLGHRLALTLLSLLPCDEVRLRVSSINAPALRLYQKLGFDRTKILSRWYLLAPTEE